MIWLILWSFLYFYLSPPLLSLPDATEHDLDFFIRVKIHLLRWVQLKYYDRFLILMDFFLFLYFWGICFSEFILLFHQTWPLLSCFLFIAYSSRYLPITAIFLSTDLIGLRGCDFRFERMLFLPICFSKDVVDRFELRIVL